MKPIKIDVNFMAVLNILLISWTMILLAKSWERTKREYNPENLNVMYGLSIASYVGLPIIFLFMMYIVLVLKYPGGKNMGIQALPSRANAGTNAVAIGI